VTSLAFTFSLDPAETVRATEELAKRARAFNTQRLLIGALVVSTASAIAAGLPRYLIAANAVILVLLVLFEVGWPRYLERQVRKFYLATPALAGMQRYVFADDGLTMSSEGSALVVRWSAILKAAETKEFFLLYYSPKAAYYLPRKAVSRDDVDALRALLRAKLGAKASGIAAST
jgi:hypothetical protein